METTDYGTSMSLWEPLEAFGSQGVAKILSFPQSLPPNVSVGGFWRESIRLDARQRHSGMTEKGVFR